MIYYLAALGAALCWAFSALTSANPSSALGAMGFVRIRMMMVFVMLAVVLLVTGGWRAAESPHLAPSISPASSAFSQATPPSSPP